MPILERGDMWSVFGSTDLFLFTSNPVVNKRGLAVMGRGIAKQLADRYPKVQKAFGTLLNTYKLPNAGIIGIFDGQLIGWCRVKDHFAQPAKISIIENSLKIVAALADYHDRIDINFPGIGNGGLAREDVLPLLSVLPDNVHVWEYA